MKKYVLIFFLLPVVWMGCGKTSAEKIIAPYCDLVNEHSKAETEKEKQEILEKMDDLEHEIKARYKGNEKLLEEIGKLAKECEKNAKFHEEL